MTTPQWECNRSFDPLRTLGLWIVFAGAFTGCSEQGSDRNVLNIACAASLQKPVTMLAEQFEQQHAVQVKLQFGGTSMLINQARLTGNVDVLITADELATQRLMETGFGLQCYPIVKQTPVLVTTDEAASKVKSRADLLQTGLRIGLGSVAATSIGRATMKGMGADAASLYEKAVVTRTSVTALATDLRVGSIDAAIVWDSTARQFQLNMITDRELGMAAEVASACVLTETANSSLANRFARYLADSSDARTIFQSCEFETSKNGSQRQAGSK